MANDVTYSSYLRLDELLGLQRPLSNPGQPDELLFIIVHQASELWFKAILHELDGLIGAFGVKDAGQSLWRLQRVNALMRIVSTQLAALESLPPQHFAKLRPFLGSSSGFQSTQFRAIEDASPKLEGLFLAMVAANDVKLEDLYLGPGPSTLYFVAEALLEYEQQFARWRFTHVQLVERVIGPLTRGTGGSTGAGYLKRTVEHQFFPALWAVRTKLG